MSLSQEQEDLNTEGHRGDMVKIRLPGRSRLPLVCVFSWLTEGALSGVFGIVAGFGEVRIGILQDRILIAMAELLFKACIAIVVVLFFGCAFSAIGIIVRNFGHIELRSYRTSKLCGETLRKIPSNHSPGRELDATPSLRRRSRACKASGERG